MLIQGSLYKTVVGLVLILAFTETAFGQKSNVLILFSDQHNKKDHAYKPGDDDNYVSWIERNGYAREFAEDWAAEFGRGPRGSSEFNTRIPTADLGTRISKLPPEYTMEAYTTMETIKMIREQAKSEKPFFCWASFYRPHQPYNPLSKYMDLYNVSEWGEGTKTGGAIKKPASFYEPTENLPPLLQSRPYEQGIFGIRKLVTGCRNYPGS